MNYEKPGISPSLLLAGLCGGVLFWGYVLVILWFAGMVGQ